VVHHSEARPSPPATARRSHLWWMYATSRQFFRLIRIAIRPGRTPSFSDFAIHRLMAASILRPPMSFDPRRFSLIPRIPLYHKLPLFTRTSSALQKCISSGSASVPSRRGQGFLNFAQRSYHCGSSHWRRCVGTTGCALREIWNASTRPSSILWATYGFGFRRAPQFFALSPPGHRNATRLLGTCDQFILRGDVH